MTEGSIIALFLTAIGAMATFIGFLVKWLLQQIEYGHKRGEAHEARITALTDNYEERVRGLSNGASDKLDKMLTSIQAGQQGLAVTLKQIAVVCQSRKCPADKKEEPQ